MEARSQGVPAKSMAEVIRDRFSVIRYTSHTKAGSQEALHATPEQIEAALEAAGYFHIGSYHFDDQGE